MNVKSGSLFIAVISLAVAACGSSSSGGSTDAGALDVEPLCVPDGSIINDVVIDVVIGDGAAPQGCGSPNPGSDAGADASAACGPLNGSCTPPAGTGNANCAEYYGFVGAQADALRTQCESRMRSWSTSPCIVATPSLNFGCRVMLPGGMCTTNMVAYSDPAQRTNAGAGCMFAGGTVVTP
ncbi:MAG: hypothetical protein R3A48_13680 [Polyangiales bacterium]